MNGDLIDDFLTIAGVRPEAHDARLLQRPGPVNAAPGWPVLEAVRALYGERHDLAENHPLANATRHGDRERKGLGRRAADVGERFGWNTDRGRYLTRDQAGQCLDVYKSTIQAFNEHLTDKLPLPLDLEARGFVERAFMPESTHIPREGLQAFYDELGSPV